MSTFSRLLLVLLVVSACTDFAESDEHVRSDKSGVYAAALSHVGDDPATELVYVVQPDFDQWEMYCGTRESPDEELAAAVGEACEVYWSTEDASGYRYTSSAISEIRQALAPLTVEFVDEQADALEPAEESTPPKRVKDDAALVIFGVPLEADGKIYLPVERNGSGGLHPSGGLVEASASGSEWEITILIPWTA